MRYLHSAARVRELRAKKCELWVADVAQSEKMEDAPWRMRLALAQFDVEVRDWG